MFMEVFWMSYCSIPCPMCGSWQQHTWEQYQLAMKCQQIMCWDSCRMDVNAPAMWIFLNKIVLDGSEEE